MMDDLLRQFVAQHYAPQLRRQVFARLQANGYQPPGAMAAPVAPAPMPNVFDPMAAPGTAASNPRAAAVLAPLGPNQWIDDVAADAYLESKRLDARKRRKPKRPATPRAPRRPRLPDGEYDFR